jgi:hypothetical protein
MADVKSRRWREPLSDVALQRGERYYDVDQQRIILHSVKLKPDVDPGDLIAAVEAAADFALNHAAGYERYRLTPDEIRRKFASLHKWLAAYLRDVQVVRPDRATRRRMARARAAADELLAEICSDVELRSTLEIAAERLADREERLPDLPPEKTPSGVVIWPVERQIDLALQSHPGMAWLSRVAKEVINRELAPAGNRADETATIVLGLMMNLYLRVASRPQKWVISPNGQVRGELLDFLVGVLRPIGDRRLHKALYDALCRLPHLPEPTG